ncbi:Uma2 family endonuclease [Micromonospora sp. NBC_00858]|uniref:Uma2 family endonuclease n=1 Tax=Micromonospora sp. NBC_00858 TaxID=2975979 RepID=UPI003863261E|nr:Uma2 family endonuclease [Micromonospora sp. NBC_00858]
MTNPARPGWGDAWTVDDLQDLPEDDQVYEIFDGSLLVLLVVEVISPSNAGRDLVLKRHEYAAAGIPLYWLVEPRKQTLTVLVNGSGGYREQAVLLGEVYRTEQPFPLALPLADIF